MQGERWKMIANFRHKLYFADCLCRPSFQAAVQADVSTATTISSQRLRFLHAICSFHLFKFKQEETTGVREDNVLSSISNYTQDLQLSKQLYDVFVFICTL